MASLDTVWASLKGAGDGSLDELLPDGYTRTLAGDGLARVNPFQVEAGLAPDPATDPGSDYSLDDWATYGHPNFPQDGSNLTAQGAYLAIDVTWTRPAGYTRDLASVNQRVYWKDMGTSQDTNVNPFDSPTGSALVGDVTSYQITGVLDGHHYAVGVKQEWDDSDEVYTTGDGSAYTGAGGQTLLLGPGVGVASGVVSGSTPPTPTTQQLTDPDTCASGDPSGVEIRCNYTLEGPGPMTLQRKLDAGAWNTVVTGITANGSYDNTDYPGIGTVYFRTFYESVSPTTYSAEASRTIQCNLI